MNNVTRWQLLFWLILVSCQDAVEPTVPLTFRYETLNEQGQPTTTFSLGEIIVVSMEIVNPTDQDYFLHNGRDVFLLHPDFMRIRGVDNAIDADLNAHMLVTDIGYYTISGHSSYRVQISYYPDTTLIGRSFSEDSGFPVAGPPTDPPLPALSAGTYFSAFAAQYTLKPKSSKEHFTIIVPLTLSFKVQ